MVVSHLLFVIHCPVTEAVEDERLAMSEVLKERQDVHLIVVTSPKINHNVLVPGILQVSDHPPPPYPRRTHAPVEEHDRARVVQLVHLTQDTFISTPSSLLV